MSFENDHLASSGLRTFVSLLLKADRIDDIHEVTEVAVINVPDPHHVDLGFVMDGRRFLVSIEAVDG